MKEEKQKTIDIDEYISEMLVEMDHNFSFLGNKGYTAKKFTTEQMLVVQEDKDLNQKQINKINGEILNYYKEYTDNQKKEEY